MTMQTASSNRTITGYLVTLLEYPRWLISRDVDFTECHLDGAYASDDEACRRCEFGVACRWLSTNREVPSLDTPLPELLGALRTATDYVRKRHGTTSLHGCDCDCDNCQWLNDANNFLRSHRHRA
jgi:hypothetical protein